MQSIATVGVLLGIVASLATVVTLLLAVIDRRRARGVPTGPGAPARPAARQRPATLARWFWASGWLRLLVTPLFFVLLYVGLLFLVLGIDLLGQAMGMEPALGKRPEGFLEEWVARVFVPVAVALATILWIYRAANRIYQTRTRER